MARASSTHPEASREIPEVTGLAVEGLFNRFDHRIELAPDSPFGIVIGPNGIGKTRFFELTRAALTYRVHDLAQSYYKKFIVTFSDGAILTYEKTEEPDKSPGVHLRLKKGRSVSEMELGDIPALTDAFLTAVDRRVPLPRVDRLTWYDDDSDETLDVFEVTQRYVPDMVASLAPLEDPFRHYIRSDAASLIETQRLVRNRPSGRRGMPNAFRPPSNTPQRNTVAVYSDQLAGLLDDRFATSGRIGQQLDRTFASRVLKRTPPTVDEERVRQDYGDQLTFRERLVEIGIADPAPEVELPSDQLLEPELRLMEEYLEDSRQKLEVFDDILPKVELMQDLIREKFLYKTFSINRQGFSVVSDEESPRPIPLASLSSGEQHELVLVYSLLFTVASQSLVMIDEPELSLHVRWQRRFLADLNRIASLSGIRFLVATHSPQIIDEWWGATTELAPEWQ